MSWEHKFANIYKEMYASGEEGGRREGGGGGGGQPAIVQIITKINQTSSKLF